MNSNPLFTRREFMGTGLVMVSTVASVPTFLRSSALAMTNPADTRPAHNRPGVPDDRILLVVQLSGGNDGLNTIPPFASDEYYKARPTLAIPRDKVLKLAPNAGVGLHPDLADLKTLYDAGLLSIIQGVGYPNPNRSHFASMDIWHTGDTRGGKGLGWIGKTLDQVAVKADGTCEPTACVCIGHDSPLAAEGKFVKPINFENAQSFRWSGPDHRAELGPAYDRINRAGILKDLPMTDSGAAAFVMRTALDAQLASDRIRAAVRQNPLTTFPANSLANQLKMVAAMIRAQLPTRVYYVGTGGFDTHANQANNHGRLLGQFAQSMRAFYDELKAIGQQDRVLAMAFSEFGRRVEQNGSAGTDHGTAGPLFLFGPMVKPGLLGEYPGLAKSKLQEGDLVYTVDFRCIYAGLMEDWLKADSKKALGQAFQPAQILRTKT